MSKVFYDNKTKQYRSYRYEVISETNSEGDKVFSLYDAWAKVQTGISLDTRQEAYTEARRLEKVDGVFRKGETL